jgi:hypothetical protein
MVVAQGAEEVQHDAPVTGFSEQRLHLFCGTIHKIKSCLFVCCEILHGDHLDRPAGSSALAGASFFPTV